METEQQSLPRQFFEELKRRRVIRVATIYVLALSIAGVVQGMGLMDPGSSFGEITRKMVPYLEARSIGGTMMTLGHFVFAAHFALLLLRKGSAVNATPTLARADAS